MRLIISVCLPILLSLQACSTSVPTAYLFTGSDLFAEVKQGAPGPKPFALTFQEESVFWEGLGKAAKELGLVSESEVGPSFRALVGADTTPFLPTALKSDVVTKLIKLNMEAISEDPEATSKAFSKGEVEEFVVHTMKGVGVSNLSAQSTPSFAALSNKEEAKTTVAQRMHKYLAVYFKGKFVDRCGNKLSKPEIKASVGNETITAVLTVILEAMYDSLYRIPVFFRIEKGGAKKVWLTSTGEMPTFAALSEVKGETVNIDEQTDIEEEELEVIQFLSEIASAQSKALSGLVIRMFGNLELGFVVAGHFAVGDNDTLAQSLEVIFEVSSGRLTEALSYKYFKKHKGDAGKFKDILELLKKVSAALKKKD
jgi:hypothetical protein